MTNTQDRRDVKRTTQQRRVQAVALPLFTERGFAATAVGEIARKAEMSVGAIYLYFKSKEDLYVSLLPDLLAPLEAALAMPSGDRRRAGGPWDVLVAWRRTHHVGAEILGFLTRPGVAAVLSADVAAAAGDAIDKVMARTSMPTWTTFLGVLGGDMIALNLGRSPGAR